MLFKKRKQQDGISINNLSTIAMGYVISHLIPHGQTASEHLSNGMPYLTASLDAVHGGNHYPKIMAGLRQSAKTIPRLAEASWDDTPIEEIIILSIELMHDGWRQYHVSSHQDSQWFMCLPLAFIGWSKVKVYYDAFCPALKCFELNLAEEVIQRIYYEYAANIFYKYNLYTVNSLPEAMYNVSSVSTDISKLSQAESRLLCNHKFVSERLEPQLANDGFGDFSKMQTFASIFNDFAGPESRQTVDDLLWDNRL